MSVEVLAVITEGLTDDHASIQKKLLLEYADQNELVIVDMLQIDVMNHPDQDDASEGSSLTHALVRVMSHEVKAVLVVSLESLVGDLIEQKILLAQFRLHGISVISATPVSSPFDEVEIDTFSRAMKTTLKYERILVQTKLQAARKLEIAKNGKCGGNPRFGSRLGEREIFDRIIALHQSGKGYTEIARLLNDEGIAPRRAAKWKPNTIANITGARRAAKSRIAKRAGAKTHKQR